MPDRLRCNAVVWRRDTYRVARGTKSGFAMHYDRSQCRRLATKGTQFCAQHEAMAGFVVLWELRATADGAPNGR